MNTFYLHFSHRSRLVSVVSLLGLALFGSAASGQRMAVANNPIEVDPGEYLDQITLPEGFSISLYATGTARARTLAVSDQDVVYVGTRGTVDRQEVGKVYAVVDSDGDREADAVNTIASDLNTPNGVTLLDGDLYIAEISRILKLADIENNLDNPPAPQLVSDNYPDEAYHGWKFLKAGPDGKLYVPVGAPCNTCERESPFASITRINTDGSDREVVARGVRNSVGFDWHPDTGELWFTDNGRDMLGDDTPPEELNRVTQPGQHFGFPYRYGKTIVDDEFSTDMKADEFTPPMAEFPAHTAGLGMRFNTGDGFPEEYQGDIFIAYHGSWNRSTPAGYYIMRVDMDGETIKNTEVFVAGWLTGDDNYWGRPVDIEFLSDGSMLVSDDHANVIYRIAYDGS